MKPHYKLLFLFLVLFSLTMFFQSFNKTLQVKMLENQVAMRDSAMAHIAKDISHEEEYWEIFNKLKNQKP